MGVDNGFLDLHWKKLFGDTGNLLDLKMYCFLVIDSDVEQCP